MDLFTLRSYQSSDESFVYSTWLKGLYYGNDWFHEIPKDLYFKNYHQVIERILSKPTCQIRCVVLKEDEDVILSYSVSEGTLLHWVFTKSAWRKNGFAKVLIPKEITQVSSMTKVGRAIKPKEWDFNPFLI